MTESTLKQSITPCLVEKLMLLQLELDDPQSDIVGDAIRYISDSALQVDHLKRTRAVVERELAEARRERDELRSELEDWRTATGRDTHPEVFDLLGRLRARISDLSREAIESAARRDAYAEELARAARYAIEHGDHSRAEAVHWLEAALAKNPMKDPPEGDASTRASAPTAIPDCPAGGVSESLGAGASPPPRPNSEVHPIFRVEVNHANGCMRCGERLFHKETCEAYREAKGWAEIHAERESTPSVSSSGADAIAAERRRQREREGWSPEHDDDHDNAGMTQAALVYAGHAVFQIRGQPYAPARRPTGEPIAWPWRPEDYKPKDARRNLVRAGALIAAEIDRLDRAALAACTERLCSRCGGPILPGQVAYQTADPGPAQHARPDQCHTAGSSEADRG